MLVIVIALFLLALSILVHYEALRFSSVRISNFHMAPRVRIVIVLVAALASHLVHVLVYAVAFLLIEHQTSFGAINGPPGHAFSDAFYFSITSYTTLGFGDLYPTGDLRLLSGIEALNGLVMVGWTASMTYLSMERFWQIELPSASSHE